MKIWILCIIFNCYYVGTCKGDLGMGKCTNVKSKLPFNLTGILGRWYVYEVNEIISAAIERCSLIDITKEPYKNRTTTIHLYISRLLIGTNYNFTTEYTATEIGHTSKFNQTGLFFQSSPLYVIDTDYTNYIILYICADVFGLFHDRNIIVATRDRVPSATTINQADKSIEDRNLGRPTNFFRINDDNCNG